MPRHLDFPVQAQTRCNGAVHYIGWRRPRTPRSQKKVQLLVGIHLRVNLPPPRCHGGVCGEGIGGEATDPGPNGPGQGNFDADQHIFVIYSHGVRVNGHNGQRSVFLGTSPLGVDLTRPSGGGVDKKQHSRTVSRTLILHPPRVKTK